MSTIKKILESLHKVNEEATESDILSLFKEVAPKCKYTPDVKDWGTNINGMSLVDYNFRNIIDGIDNILIQVHDYDSSQFDITIYADDIESYKKALDELKLWGFKGNVRVERAINGKGFSAKKIEFN